MNKQAGLFKFDYIELKDKNEIASSLLIETTDLVHSIGKFGESRKLIHLDVREIKQ